jgi:hypothetical protein
MIVFISVPFVYSLCLLWKEASILNVVSQHGEDVIISASTSELAQLGKLLDWILDNMSVMDKGMILVPGDEILPLIQKWETLIESSFGK